MRLKESNPPLPPRKKKEPGLKAAWHDATSLLPGAGGGPSLS